MATPNQLGAKRETNASGLRNRDNNSMDANARTFSFGDDDDENHNDEPRCLMNGNGNKRTTTTDDTTTTTSATLVRYDVEHLATFSTATSHEQQRAGAASSGSTTTNDKRDNGLKLGGLKQRLTGGNDSSSSQRAVAEPREALQQLFELEKLSGIWTQRMQIGFDREFMLIVDCETDSVVERFHRKRVTKPEAFNHYSDIYSNIIVFNIDQQRQNNDAYIERALAANNDDSGRNCDRITSGELHIFQCISHKAKQLVADILAWKSAEVAIDGKLARVGLIDDDMSNKTNNSQRLAGGKPTDSDKFVSELASESEPAKMSATKSPSSSGDKAQESRDEEAVGKLSLKEVATTTTDNNNSSSSSKPTVTVASSGSKPNETLAVVPNVSVKETVQVFNQIAALREKSVGINQTARPLSDASGSSSQSNSSSQQQPGASSSGGAGFSRAHLNSAGQSYKQRSIRATLAPKNQAPDSGDTQNGSASSSSANHKAASLSSQPEHKSTETPTTIKTSYRDGRPLTEHQQKLAAAAANASNTNDDHNTNHTQASPVDQHNHDHNNQHQHNHRQASLVNSGKSSANASATASINNSRKSSNQSRLPATNGHNHHHHNNHHHHHQDILAGANSSSSNSNSSSRSQKSAKAQQVAPPDEQVTSNESYVSVLNHCFDDIEKFILQIQHAYAAVRELQAKRRHTKRSMAAPSQPIGHPNGPLPPPPPSMSATELARLVARAQGPSPDDYMEILSKFKLAFNLLAKLKGCIHEPNAPELIHFLFTPLAIIIESARNVTPPIDPTIVGIPYLNKDALELLSNCCTSRESDLWYSLGPNWTETIDAQLLNASRLPNSFQPIFSDGWAPVISELELIGLVAQRPPVSPVALDTHHNYPRASKNANSSRPDADHTLTAFNGSGHLAQSAIGKPSRQKGIRPSTRHPIESSSYMHTEYLGDDMIDSVGPSLDEQPRTYSDNDVSISSKQRPVRNSMPGGPNASRSAARLPTQAAAQRRNSDFISHQYGPPPPSSMPLTNSFIGPKDDDLNGRYAAGYSVAPSNDYTELNIDDGSHRDGHHYRVAGYLAHHGTQHALNDHNPRRKGSRSRSAYGNGLYQQRFTSDHHVDHGLDLISHDMEREAMLADIGPAQTEWFYELKLRGALIVRVLFTREANNDKELTVKRGEILEILDDTRKWWKARNIDLQVAHVPHTIVAVMEHYQTLDELLTGSAGDMIMMVNEDQLANVDSQQYVTYRDQAQPADGGLQGRYYGLREERRNSKNAQGAFRYF